MEQIELMKLLASLQENLFKTNTALITANKALIKLESRVAELERRLAVTSAVTKDGGIAFPHGPA